MHWALLLLPNRESVAAAQFDAWTYFVRLHLEAATALEACGSRSLFLFFNSLLMAVVGM